MSDNVIPAKGALSDDTLRRSGARDLSDVNESGAPQWQNPRTDIFEPQVAGRTAVVSDIDLHLGIPPQRIDRINSDRNLGLAGPLGNGIDKSGEYMLVSHVPAAHFVKGVTPIPSHTVDDNIALSTPRIGNPLS